MIAVDKPPLAYYPLGELVGKETDSDKSEQVDNGDKEQEHRSAPGDGIDRDSEAFAALHPRG